MKEHPIINTFLTLRGNPRACLYSEPLWFIPYSLYMPYVSIYMQAIGLTDSQIGLVASVTMFVMAVFAVLSGAITDKLGRKRATFIFDMLSWSIPCVIWALSQNFWWFMTAAVFNGMAQVTANSWTCLLVEDAEKSIIVRIYSIIHLIAQMAVVFAPISIVFIDLYTVVPVMRVLYTVSFISMTTKFLVLNHFSTETKVGKVRMEETKAMSIIKIISGYGDVFRRILKSKKMILALLISVIFNIVTMITNNFFGLFTTGNLLVPEHFLGYFPIVRAVVIVFFLFFLSKPLHNLGFKRPMLTGVLIYITGHIVLLMSPGGNLIVPFIYVFIEACAFSLVMPNKDSLVAILIDPDERARISSIMTSLVLGLSIPFGYFAGRLSDSDRRLPFILNIILFSLVFIIIFISKEHADNKEL